MNGIDRRLSLSRDYKGCSDDMDEGRRLFRMRKQSIRLRPECSGWRRLQNSFDEMRRLFARSCPHVVKFKIVWCCLCNCCCSMATSVLFFGGLVEWQASKNIIDKNERVLAIQSLVGTLQNTWIFDSLRGGIPLNKDQTQKKAAAPFPRKFKIKNYAWTAVQ